MDICEKYFRSLFYIVRFVLSQQLRLFMMNWDLYLDSFAYVQFHHIWRRFFDNLIFLLVFSNALLKLGYHLVFTVFILIFKVYSLFFTSSFLFLSHWNFQIQYYMQNSCCDSWRHHDRKVIIGNVPKGTIKIIIARGAFIVLLPVNLLSHVD